MAESSSRPDKPYIFLDQHNRYADATLRRILGSVRTIAMIGASTTWHRPSFFAAKYLMRKGYRVFPVNPTRAGEEMLGETVYASLDEVPGPIDMIDVFRASKEAFGVVEDVVRLKDEKDIQVIWMQLTVRDDAAAEVAEAAGLQVVMDRCPKIEFARLSGELGWSGINSGVISAKSLRPPRA